ncbi:MAG: aminotransferase class V-fold PLP-dependent enzyme [Gemmatimonadales bacterium]
MSRRRTFLKQMVSVAGATGLGGILAVQRAFGEQLLDLTSVERGNWQRLRDRYLLDPGITYFNHGSIGTVPRAVHEAHVGYLRVCEKNPWLYMWGGEWEEPREEVRRKSARLLGCSPEEVALTHNTTEGFSILAGGLDLGPGDEVLFSSLNHDGASVSWYHNAKSKGFTVRRFHHPLDTIASASADEVLDLYDRQITSRTRVLVLPHIDNMVGLLHPVKELAALARGRGVEIVAVDGAQSVGMREVNVRDLDVDVYCASPHKWVQAPKGTGMMYLRSEIQREVRPMWMTWGQERWKGTVRVFEDYGTRNLPELLAMGDAIDFQTSLGSDSKEERYRELWELFRGRAHSSGRVIWRSPESWELSASLFALEVKGKDSRDVFDTMYHQRGFVFRAFHTKELNTVRISPNVFATDDDVTRFFDGVASL